MSYAKLAKSPPLVGPDLTTNAFEKAWRFVERDPHLSHRSEELLRNRLMNNIEAGARRGEHDLLTLANAAIWKLRKELGTPQHRRSTMPAGHDA